MSRPSCYVGGAAATVPSPFFDHEAEASACMAWTLEGEWRKYSHDCEGCRRLERARAIGRLEEA